MAIFVSQVMAKSQVHKIFKSQNLTDFLRFKPIFFSHMKSIYISESIHKVSWSNNNLEPLVDSQTERLCLNTALVF